MDKIKEMTMKDLINIKKLNMYGMGITGDGTFGVYKLLFAFCADEIVDGTIIDSTGSTGTTFIEKVKLVTRDRTVASQLADFTLSHYLKETI